MRPAWVSLLFLTMMLAGCAGANEPATAEPVASDPVIVDSGDGAHDLSVLVVDETITPIAGVKVTIDALSLSGLTGADGMLVFEGLDEGLYMVAARLTGYLNATTLVDLTDDAEARFLLSKDPAYIEPYIVSFALNGFINGTEHSPSRSANTDVFYRDCKCWLRIEDVADIEGFVVDVAWQDSIAKPIGDARKFRFLITSDITFDWEIRRGPTPWTETVPISRFDAGQESTWWELMLYPDDDWIKYQQPFQAYWTLFVGQEVPDGWTLHDP